MLCLPCLEQKFEASAEEVKTATQYTGTLQPLVKEKPTLEFVKITQDMKVRRRGGAFMGQLGRDPLAAVQDWFMRRREGAVLTAGAV